jgi:2-dehydropantoate 2-reductase
VFGLYLQKAGVELGYYARPASAAKLRQALILGGLPLFQTTSKRKGDPIAQQLGNYRVMTDVAACQRFGPDQIWFTTPSTVYYTEWFRQFLREVPSKRVVCFAPEGRRAEFLPEGIDGDRLVCGGITFMAWQGDLGGGGGRPNAVNYWLPPTLNIPLMGAQEACREVKGVLREAGFRATAKKERFRRTQAAVTGVMQTYVAGLELAGWSLRAYRVSPWLVRAARGAREAVASQLARNGILTRAFLGAMLSSVSLRCITRLLPLLFPFDIEQYLQFHYLKTRDQTLALLELFAEDGQKRGLAVENIRALLQGLYDVAG